MTTSRTTTSTAPGSGVTTALAEGAAQELEEAACLGLLGGDDTGRLTIAQVCTPSDFPGWSRRRGAPGRF